MTTSAHRSAASHRQPSGSVALLCVDARGGNLLEYAIVVGVVALAALVAVRLFGGAISAKARCYAAVLEHGGSCSGDRFLSPGLGEARDVARATSAHGVEPTAASKSLRYTGPFDPAFDDVAPLREAEERAHLSPSERRRAILYAPYDGPAFVRGAGDAHAVDPSDITQGLLGDCYLLASLGAVATRNPARIEELIHETPGGYAITFKAPFSLGEPTQVLTPTFPTVVKGGSRMALFAQPGDAGADGRREIWPMLVEKAYAWERRSYGAIGNTGGNPADALFEITGNNPRTINRSDDAFTFESLANEWKAGHAIVAGTLQSGDEAKQNPLFRDQHDGRPPLVTRHAYYVTGLDATTKTITLRNPQGWDLGETTVTWDAFASAFAHIDSVALDDDNEKKK